MAYERFENVEALYLNPHSADVWFVFGKERIPAHKSLLTPIADMFGAMCHSRWQPGDDVDLTNAGYSAAAFKQFLRYLYLHDPKLTLTNICDVINLANMSLMADGILFRKCEDFLIDSLTVDTLPLVYALAVVYEDKSDRLMRACKEDVCLFAGQILRSSSFLKCDFELLEYILHSDSLTCNEKQVFAGCIAWAKAACKRNKQDVKSVENIRDQLKQVFTQIRFGSMTSGEFAACIQPYPGLFKVDELREIIDTMGGQNAFGPKKFKSMQRGYDQSIKYDGRGKRLECIRYGSGREKKAYAVKRVERTAITCNRRVLLKGFSCERRSGIVSEDVVLSITKQKNDGIVETRFNPTTKNLRFVRKENIESFEAQLLLDYAILLEPNFVYSIIIEFAEQSTRSDSVLKLKRKVRVDHDIVFRFKDRGIITALNIIRIDRRSYGRRIANNPIVWMLCVALCALVYVLIHKFKPGWINYFHEMMHF